MYAQVSEDGRMLGSLPERRHEHPAETEARVWTEAYGLASHAVKEAVRKGGELLQVGVDIVAMLVRIIQAEVAEALERWKASAWAALGAAWAAVSAAGSTAFSAVCAVCAGAWAAVLLVPRAISLTPHYLSGCVQILYDDVVDEF